jgi:septum site-determining protein MinD
VILAVAGGKGGVGTSTLAFELGAALDGVVVDADLGMADLPSGPGPGPDLHDVLVGRADPLEALRPSRAVTLLPCGRSLAGARAADVGGLAAVLETVTDARGTVVVDCPNGMRADTGVPLAVADACLVVVSPREFAVVDAVRTRELARELDTGLAAVAVNRTVDDPPLDAVSRVLGAPAVGVPADPRLRSSIQTGRPVVETAPDSLPAGRVGDLAAAVRSCQ